MNKTKQKELILDLNCVTCIGIDNGTTGSIGIIEPNNKITYIKTPTFTAIDYHTSGVERKITRIDFKKLNDIFFPYIGTDLFILSEIPLVNPRRFRATISSVRALESTLIALESVQMKTCFISAKKWQRVMFGLNRASKNNDNKLINTKQLSTEKGIELFPEQTDFILSHGDADGLLIAEYARRNLLKLSKQP